MEDLVGRTLLDRYEVVELIGEGGMATVYRARDTRLGRDVAVKVMLPALVRDLTVRRRFEHEAQTIASLRHPNILTVYDYGQADDGRLYLVVDYVSGGTLSDQVGGPRSLSETVEIVAQVAEALDYAHRQGLIHRDVKPNNILLDEEGRPLLADFGLAKPIHTDKNLTADGVMMGTPNYMAPEQALGLSIDGRTDLYALGVMLFEMLTGQLPYPGESSISVILQHVSEPMPRLTSLNPDLPPALDQVIEKGTNKSPEGRYQCGADMARALRAALTVDVEPGPERPTEAPLPTDGPATLPTPVPSPPTPLTTPFPQPYPWYRQPNLWAGVAVVAVLLLVIGGLLWLNGSQDREMSPPQVPTAQPDEIMILIAQFKAKAGSESFDVSQRIYDKLSDNLSQLEEEGVSLYQVAQVVESSEAAVALGERYGATTVIWGYYDDIGISPNVEAVGGAQDSLLSVGLERFNLDAGDAVSFKLYVAKDLPEELSFLTALSLFQAFILQNRLAEALGYLEMAEANLPADPQFRSGGEMIYFAQALLAFFRGDLVRTGEEIDQAIELAPDRALFHTLRGVVHLRIGESDLALGCFEQAIRLEPEDLLAYVMKGLTLWRLGDWRGSLDTYDQMIALDPTDTTAYYGKATVGVELGDLTLTLDAVEQLERLDPDDPLAALPRALIHEKLGYVDQVEADYAQVLARGVPPDASIQLVRLIMGEGRIPAYSYLYECAIYQAQGELERALQSCDRALQADPAYFDAWWKRGQLRAAQGDWEATVADYSAAIRVDPTYPWVYYLRAQALLELGRTDQAQVDLERALDLDPPDELRQQIESLRGG